MSGFLHDIGYAARVLLKRPGFTISAIVTMSLGISLVTGGFSIWNAFVFRDLPVPAANELVAMSQTVDGMASRIDKGQNIPWFSTEEYHTFRDRTEMLSGIMGYSNTFPAVFGGDNPSEVTGRVVTCSYFDVLQQPPALGRSLVANDCESGAVPVVILSYEFWTTTLGADRSILDQTITLNRQSFTVVGIASDDVYQPDSLKLSFFAPASTLSLIRPNWDSLNNDAAGWLALVGRRDASSSIDQVRAELAIIAAEIDQQQPGRLTTLSVERATPWSRADFYPDVTYTGVFIMVVFGLVLLIACANVANLFLARGTLRSQEIAIRLSLGASRARVVQQLLTESLLVSFAGSVLGLLLGLWFFEWALARVLEMSFETIVFPDLSPDGRVLALTLLLMIGTTILIGLVPSLQASRRDLHTSTKQSSPGSGSGARGRLQGLFIGVQVGVCMVLLTGTGLLLRGLHAAQTFSPEVDFSNVTVASFDLNSFGYDADAMVAFQDRLADQVSALPGVASVGYGARLPLGSGGDMYSGIFLPGEDPAQFRRAERNMVTPGYFDTIGLPILRGRTFVEDELVDVSTTVIVTESTADNLWPGQDPIGKTVFGYVGLTEDGRVLNSPLQVVGVAPDAQTTAIGQIDPYYVYMPIQPRFRGMLNLVVKSQTNSTATESAIRSVFQGLDPSLPIRVFPLEAILAERRQSSAFSAAIAGAVGGLALLLATVGIFGVVSFVVNQLTREIGIRMALGARRFDMISLALRRTMRPVVFGSVLGVVGAIGTSRFLVGELSGVSPADPIGIGGGALFVLVAAAVACTLPAGRASRVDPTAALRAE